MTDRRRPEASDTDRSQSPSAQSDRDVLDALRTYLDGKMQRYRLLFAVNGAAFAIAKIIKNPDNTGIAGALNLLWLAVGAIVFTTLLWIDIWAWGEMMRRRFEYLHGDTIFQWKGKWILSGLASMLIVAWGLAAWDELGGLPPWLPEPLRLWSQRIPVRVRFLLLVSPAIVGVGVVTRQWFADRPEQRCRICEATAAVREENEAYTVQGCECGNAFRAQGAFWLAARRIRAAGEEHRFSQLSGYIRQAAKDGDPPLITLANWWGLAERADPGVSGDAAHG